MLCFTQLCVGLLRFVCFDLPCFCFALLRCSFYVALRCFVLRGFVFIRFALRCVARFCFALLRFVCVGLLSFCVVLRCDALLCLPCSSSVRRVSFCFVCFALIRFGLPYSVLLCVGMLRFVGLFTFVFRRCCLWLAFALFCIDLHRFALACYGLLCFAWRCFALLDCFALRCYCLHCFVLPCFALLCVALALR